MIASSGRAAARRSRISSSAATSASETRSVGVDFDGDAHDVAEALPQERPGLARDRLRQLQVAYDFTSDGISISRLRILPVGPFGSSSTNQILRGYL